MNCDNKENDNYPVAWLQEKSVARLGGEKALMLKLGKLFVKDSPSLMRDVLSAIEQQSYDAAFIPLHSLKGTSSNFCTLRFEHECDNMLLALKDQDWQRVAKMHEHLVECYWELDKELRCFIEG